VNGEELVGELDALFVPGLGANLYSIEVATELGITSTFMKTKLISCSKITGSWLVKELASNFTI
jgi:hypothetical protein